MNNRICRSLSLWATYNASIAYKTYRSRSMWSNTLVAVRNNWRFATKSATKRTTWHD